MFIVNILLNIVKFVIITMGTICLCAITLGKSAPFRWTARRIERRNARNAARYLSRN